MNTEIKNLHSSLILIHQALAKRLGDTTSIDEANAILTEMDEVNFRVMIAGSMLFKDTTEKMDDELRIVIDARGDLEASIKQTQQIKQVIKGIGQFLTIVDRALDLLKLV